MTAVGKLQASLASATQETTLALANVNFDFSLVKVKAPTEYQPLGAALSTKRRTAAENGSPHMIARRLATLFESILPSTPRLIAAYGQRASEISQSPAIPSGSRKHGPFEDYVGLDGTNIWAAATSGPGAIMVHLLACMLARLWPPAEAVSIWDEMVLERKKELTEGEASNSMKMKDFAAAQVFITRDQLAEWDSSARSWLRTADRLQCNVKRQKQLTLILKTLNLPVSGRLQVYASVCKAWQTALSTMDKLVGGEAHSVEDGALLVALSAWHLYPDMVVLGKQSQEVLQNDDLIQPGGVLTIGLQGANQKAGQGVHWSLSLAHLRYYGQPVLTSSSVSSDPGRISFRQMCQVIFGSVISSWGVDIHSVNEAATLFLCIFHCFESGLQSYAPNFYRVISHYAWMKLLAESAEAAVKEPDGEVTKLLRLGYRRRGFLTTMKSNQIFGLQGLGIIRLLAEPEVQIRLIREFFADWSLADSSLIIRLGNEHISEDENSIYLTVVPSMIQGKSMHTTYIPDTTLVSMKHESTSERVVTLQKEQIVADGSFTTFTWHWPSSQNETSEVPQMDQPLAEKSGLSSLKSEERTKSVHGDAIPTLPANDYEFVLGRLDGVSLFKRKDLLNFEKDLTLLEPQYFTVAKLTALFKDGSVDSRRLVRHIEHLGSNHTTRQMVDALRALTGSALLYEHLPGATISPHVFSSGLLALKKWTGICTFMTGNIFETLKSVTLSRAAAFSCIAFFESGSFDLDPNDLQHVMAISSGDSIYVAAPLLSDPGTSLARYEMRMVIGNIGRAGLALLIPPRNLMYQSRDPEKWRVVNHEKFNGRLEDNFTSTSLHLRFTGYELPVMAGEHGNRFVEAFFIEAVISVHDSGKWIADLDIIKALSSSSLAAVVSQPGCQSSQAGSLPSHDLVAIDNWQELLDAPNESAVVRAHGNWQARLAMTAVSIHLKHPTILFEGHGCWDCGIKTMQELESERISLSAQRPEELDWKHEEEEKEEEGTEPKQIIFVL